MIPANPRNILRNDYLNLTDEQYANYFKKCFDIMVMEYSDPVLRHKVNYEVQVYFEHVLSYRFFIPPPPRLWKRIDPLFQNKFPNGRVSNALRDKVKEQFPLNDLTENEFKEMLEYYTTMLTDMRNEKPTDEDIFFPMIEFGQNADHANNLSFQIEEECFRQQEIFHEKIKQDIESYRGKMGRFSAFYYWTIPKIQLLDEVSKDWQDYSDKEYNGVESKGFWRRIYFLVLEYIYNNSFAEGDKYEINFGENILTSEPFEIFSLYIDENLYYFTKENRTRLPLNVEKRDYLFFKDTDIALKRGKRVNDRSLNQQAVTHTDLFLQPFDIGFRIFIENQIWNELFMKENPPTLDEFVDMFPQEFKDYPVHQYGLRQAYRQYNCYKKNQTSYR